MYEPGVRPIGGHFIDEKRSRRLAVASGVGKILLAEAAQVRGTQIRDRLYQRGLAIRLAGAGEFTCNSGKGGQLHGAFDRRVARENLFEQGGTGSRQAYDEYGFCRRCTRLACGKKISAVLPLAPADVPGVFLRAIRMQRSA